MRIISGVFGVFFRALFANTQTKFSTILRMIIFFALAGVCLYFGGTWLASNYNPTSTEWIGVVFVVFGWILLAIGIMSVLRVIIDLIRLCTRKV